MEKEKTYWCLVFENFEGDFGIYYFNSIEIAKANLKAIFEKVKNNDDISEIEYDEDDWLSYFDANYNDENTYIYLFKKNLPPIYDKVIF